jgi:hypothetical protein
VGCGEGFLGKGNNNRLEPLLPQLLCLLLNWVWGSWERQEMAFQSPWKHLALKARLDIEFRGARVYITGRTKTENGNSGLMTRAFTCRVPS